MEPERSERTSLLLKCVALRAVKRLTPHDCVAPFFFLRCCCPLGMINPEELNIEGVEEIDGRLMIRKEEIGKKRYSIEPLLYVCTSNRVHHHLALCLLINSDINQAEKSVCVCVSS